MKIQLLSDLHLEANPGNARALLQGHGERDVWLNPPPLPVAESGWALERDAGALAGALNAKKSVAAAVRTAATICAAGTPRASRSVMTRRPSWPVAPVMTIMGTSRCYRWLQDDANTEFAVITTRG